MCSLNGRVSSREAVHKCAKINKREREREISEHKLDFNSNLCKNKPIAPNCENQSVWYIIHGF